MKAFLYTLCLGLFLWPPAAEANPPDAQEWQLTFADDFHGDRLDRAKWNTTQRYGGRNTPSNKEAQYYMDDAFEFTGGLMRIRAEERDVAGFHYTSGILTTYSKFSQRYGYFEMRAKLPEGKGFWPAFWMMPVAKKWPPEIDVMENLGHEPDIIYDSNHFAGSNSQSQGICIAEPDAAKAFHDYAVWWKPGEIIWYLDGKECYRTTHHVPQEPMYVIANLAVGGSWGGYPDENTLFPGYMDIAHIRVWREKGL